jgi:uncharacterized protein YjbI with pentapeptide repeats
MFCERCVLEREDKQMRWKRPNLPCTRRKVGLHLRRLYQTVGAPAKSHVEQSSQWLMAHQQTVFLVAGVSLAVVLLFVNVTAAAAVTATWVALLRHYAQTEADRQRRVTETFSNAIDQLASEKLEIRLGGIYTLERIADESLQYYLTVAKLLCAFVREQAPRKVPDESSSEKASSEMDERTFDAESRRILLTFAIKGLPEPRADITAALAAVSRRSRQKGNAVQDDLLPEAPVSRWPLDLRHAYLEGVNLAAADLRGAWLIGTDLHGALLMSADLRKASLVGAIAYDVSFERADLRGADLSGADVSSSWFAGANLAGAVLKKAKLDWADLSEVYGLSQEQLASADGNLKTRLPDGMPYPPHWPEIKPS